jgi:GNAT superfamily N-acetyltransferase
MRDRKAFRRLAARLPDEPGWVDFRGMLLSGACDAHGDARGGILVSRIYPVCAVVGRPGGPLLRQLLRASPAPDHVLCRDETEAHVRRALRGWRRRGAILHVRPRGRLRAPRDPHVRRLTEADRAMLRHVPVPLRREVGRNLARGVTVAYLHGRRPVSFAYACWETRRWFDISVDTLTPYRRRGFAFACVRRLISEMRRRGKRPVWGALEDNRASLRMAERLGFRPADRVWVFSRPPKNRRSARSHRR